MATTRLTVKHIAASRPHPDASGVRRIAVELAPLFALYAVYTFVRWIVSDRGPVAGGRHARSILNLEDWLRIDWELGIQHAVLNHVWLTKAANWYYAYGFLPVLVPCAILGAWKIPAVFRWWRRVFSISLALALIGYSAYPLTPPRLLPAAFGYVDTLLRYGPHYYGDATGSSLFNLYGSIPSTVNVYAAMPSMHVAWSVIAGALFCAVMAGRRWAVIPAALHPMLMACAVVVTANHYILDIVVGLIVLAISLWVSRRWQMPHHPTPSHAAR